MKWIDKLMGNMVQLEPLDDSEPPKVEEGVKLAHWSGVGKLPITIQKWLRPITTTEKQASDIESMESFSDLISPRMDIGDYVLMDDLSTVGAVFDVTPIVTDARSESYLKDVQDKIVGILKEAIPRDIDSPWMLQVTLQDETSMDAFKSTIEKYPEKAHKGTPIRHPEFAKEWLRILNEHIDDVSDSNGLFEDQMVSGGIWYGRYRKVRIYLWRKDPHIKNDHGEQLEDLIDKIKSRFAAADIKIKQQPASELRNWLRRFFAPTAKDTPYHDEEMLRLLGVFNDGASGDIVRDSLNGQYPYSDDRGNWYFENKPVRFISVEQPSCEPRIGCISSELENGDQRYAMWDKMPIGTVYSQTIIFEHEDVIDAELEKMEKDLLGEDEKSKLRRGQIKQIRQEIAKDNIVLKSFAGVYVRGEDDKDLKRKVRTASTWLDNAGLKTIPPQLDLVAQDYFIRGLPFNFDRKHDRDPALRRARKYFIKQIAKIVPFYGRSRGTGNPGFAFWNRGGEPFSFDPLIDRAKNAFTLILGPTGSGKSALLNFIIAQYVAFYGARFFIIEKGKSFYLLGRFLKRFGVKVHQVVVTPDKPISLNPFNNACNLPEVLGDDGINEGEHDLIDEYVSPDSDEDESEDDQRDELAEMLLAAVTMITGGERKELDLLRRRERFDLMKAIVQAGKNTFAKGYTLPEDVRDALREASLSPELSDSRRERLTEFADNMQFWCEGIRGKFFNRQGEAWPEADVTIFDVGMLVNSEYADMLGVSVVSMLNKIISIAERDQYSGRPIITLADEGHLTTTNPLIAPIVTSMTKMARKLNLWFWLATQNLKDFKDESAKMLSNFEWWVTMSTGIDEVNQISRFKELTEEQKALLLAARKEPGKYTEGIVMSDRILSLFRNVPPSIAMALAQTEGDEKRERKKLMDEHGISELEAAYMIAEQMRSNRKTMRKAA